MRSGLDFGKSGWAKPARFDKCWIATGHKWEKNMAGIFGGRKIKEGFSFSCPEMFLPA
jgi:hypothetical protein